LNGRDLRGLPLIERKEILKAIVEKGDNERVLYSDHWEGTGDRILRRGCEMGLEGVISKDKLALYQSGRGEAWVKSKCLLGQEVIIAGYTEPQGRRTGFGSLVLAAYDDAGVLRHLGRVGTGFDHRKILDVLKKMKPLRTSKSPVPGRVPDQSKIRWVKPKLVCEIFFHGWTEDGRLRQAVFRDLRLDKPAREVKIDRPISEAELMHDESPAEKRREKTRSKKARAALAEIPQLDIEEMAAEEEEGHGGGRRHEHGQSDRRHSTRTPDGSQDRGRYRTRSEFAAKAVRKVKARTKKASSKTEEEEGEVVLSNPDKILIPEGKVTKRRVRDYLRAVAPWILPHVAERPLSLVRCPDGADEECFFQKNLIHRGNGELRQEPIRDPKGKTASIIWIDSARGLESLAQMGTLEIHAWGTHRDHVLKPDLVVFDLDPDGSVPWKAIADGALRIREIMTKLGLKSFLKISGNKGVHVHVPIAPERSWEEVRNFAHAIARLLEEEKPELYISNMSKEKRKGKIFIDYLRNGYGATSVVPYSIRKKNGGAVALPIEWSQLRRVDPKGWSMKKTIALLKKRKPGGKDDPWKDYFKVRQRLPDFGARAGEAEASRPR
jgi:bifunctional non-homologous end joining protein LigD